MKIVFHLEFLKPGKKINQAFKNECFFNLLKDYTDRIDNYDSCEVLPSLERSVVKLTASDKLWICDRSKGSKILSSEDVSIHLNQLRNDGVKILRIVIGGPDGFSQEFFEKFHPQLKWCFGPLTLPHELASVLAAEQIYRAWTIIKKEPYHLGH